MNKVGDEKIYPPLAKNRFLGKKGGGSPPQISQKFNLVQLSSNFQGRPDQINEKGSGTLVLGFCPNRIFYVNCREVLSQNLGVWFNICQFDFSAFKGRKRLQDFVEFVSS